MPSSRPSLALAIAALSAALLALGPAASARAERQHYTVVAGDVLGEIALRFGVSVEELLEWNTLPNDRIQIGRDLLVSPEVAPEAAEERASFEFSYVVLRGDNVTRIAERVGMTVEALREANPQLRPDRIRPGQRLRLVGATRVVDHVARRGETLARLASRYEVRHLDLLAWNPALNRRGLDTGMTVRIYTDVRISRSESVGAPNDGALAHGEVLPAHRAYIVRDPARAIGTHETVQWIVEAFDAALDADPSMTRVRVHDLGVSGGGRLAGHRSHQSGRDADIAYYRRQCRDTETCFMNRSRPEDLDAAHQWRVFRYWLEHHVVTAIFVDHALQEPLYEYARTHGASAAELEAWFQYPRASTVPVGIIRHFPGHDDHFHVRFICPSGDDSCTEAVRRAPPPTSLAHRDTHAEPRHADAEHADAGGHAPHAANTMPPVETAESSDDADADADEHDEEARTPPREPAPEPRATPDSD